MSTKTMKMNMSYEFHELFERDDRGYGLWLGARGLREGLGLGEGWVWFGWAGLGWDGSVVRWRSQDGLIYWVSRAGHPRDLYIRRTPWTRWAAMRHRVYGVVPSAWAGGCEGAKHLLSLWAWMRGCRIGEMYPSTIQEAG